jgi:hypothetical protein
VQSLYRDLLAESLRPSPGILNYPIRIKASDVVADTTFRGILHACKAAAKKWLYAVSSPVMAWLVIIEAAGV